MDMCWARGPYLSSSRNGRAFFLTVPSSPCIATIGGKHRVVFEGSLFGRR
jgi:hypothetical protein